MPANEVNPSTGVETPGPARVNALRARGFKRVALYPQSTERISVAAL